MAFGREGVPNLKPLPRCSLPLLHHAKSRIVRGKVARSEGSYGGLAQHL